jgi:hypothetical protein
VSDIITSEIEVGEQRATSTGSLSAQEMRKAREKFRYHKWTAKQRNISFEFTFEEWITFWLASEPLARARLSSRPVCNGAFW